MSLRTIRRHGWRRPSAHGWLERVRSGTDPQPPWFRAFIRVTILALACLSATPGVAADDRASTQEQLDAACEAARERELEPERAQYVQECVQQKTKSTLEDCQRFYSDYGARTGDRAPLYYDLPECVTAFEYRQNYRQ